MTDKNFQGKGSCLEDILEEKRESIKFERKLSNSDLYACFCGQGG